MKPIRILLRANPVASTSLNTGDFYVAPAAAGTGDGLSAANAMSWASHSAQSAATLSGKTVVVMPGTFSLKTIGINGNAATVTYIPRDPANPPVFDQLTINACSKLKLQQLKIVTSAWSATSNNSNPCLLFSGTSGVITLDRCTLKGNYRGDVTATFDPVAEYPEYASVAATMSGGAVTVLTVTHSYVGDLMAPGTYALTLNETSGTGFSATMTVTNTTLNGITGNHITSTTLTSGGSGYTMTLNEAARITWTGQHRMFEYIVEAMRSSGSITDLSVLDCTMTDTRNGIKITAPTGTFTFTGNTMDRIYESGFSVGLASATAPPVTVLSDNLGTRFFYKSDDAGNPHGGFLRPSMNTTTPSDWVITCERNVYIPDSSRGVPYFALLSDCPAGVYYRARIVGNLGLSNGGANDFNMDGMRDCYIYRNTWVRYDPNDADTASVSVTLPSPAQASNCAGKSYAANNITENLTNSNTTKIVDQNNIVLGTDPGAAAYNAAFISPTSLPTTKVDALADFAPSVTNAGKGGGGSDGYLDYTNRTYDKTLEPTFVNFDALSDQTTSTAVSSAWCRVLGGPDSQSWSVTGGTAQIADDASGTNATAAATSGTVARDKFMRVNQTTSASGSTTTTATLTINGYAFDFAAATQSAAVFATVDNQTTAYSTSGPPATATGLKRFLVAMRFKPDAVATNMNFVCDSTATGIRLFAASTSAYRWQFMSGVVTHRSTLAPTTGWETHIMAIDLTQTDPANVSKWYCNGVNVAQAASTVAGDGTGTQSKGTANFIATALGLFAKTDGTNLMDGQGAFFWMHYGDATFSLPDISDPAVQNMFTADNINLTNGSGPLGFQPKIFFYGANAAAWNAGLANKGSESMTMTKIAGTYA